MRVAFVPIVLALAATPAAAQNQPPPQPRDPVVVTSGEGVVKRVPDRAWVTISAESRAKGPREAQKMNADAMSAVLQRLKGAGLPAEAIRTLAYDLQPEFDYANGRQTLRGYVARNSVEVRVDDLPRLGEILDAAVTSGATNVGGVRFDVKDRAAAEREALRLAVADARARADAAAAGGGVKVERILRIEEHRAVLPPPRPIPMTAMREAAVMAAEPPVAAGELEIKANVTLTAIVR
jgi:uncharacterized protein YggE